MDFTPKFTFHFIENAQFSSFSSKETQDYLQKWDMKDQCYALKFRFDEPLKRYQVDDFLVQFFNDSTVRAHLQVATGLRAVTSFGGATAKAVIKEELACNVISLDFFNRLVDRNIVRESGSIAQCLHKFIDYGITVSDRLRDLFICGDPSTQHLAASYEDCEDADVFNEDDRNEFIYHIMRRLCIGGAMNQFEDEFEPYKSTTKLLYKDFVSVHRSQTGEPEVISRVFSILDVLPEDEPNVTDGSQPIASKATPRITPLWPRENPFNFLYVSIDNVRRHAIVWYNAFLPL